jgi:hypothetical protein
MFITLIFILLVLEKSIRKKLSVTGRYQIEEKNTFFSVYLIGNNLSQKNMNVLFGSDSFKINQVPAILSFCFLQIHGQHLPPVFGFVCQSIPFMEVVMNALVPKTLA